jgi:two-component system, NtrC family, sensor kinase
MPKWRATRLLHDISWVAAFGVVIGLLAAAEVWRSYSQATAGAERSVSSLARLLAEHTERTIQAIDFSLIGMRDALQLAPNLAADDPAYRASMIERLKALPDVRALFVVGPDGFIIHDTDYPATPRVTLADRPYFQAHRGDPGLGLRIGQPLRSRSVGVWFVSLSRRITNADGSFGGIVVAAVEPSYFKRLYEDLAIGEDKLFALLLSDGTLLARTPQYDETIGRSYADSPVRKLAVERGSGVTRHTSATDGSQRIIGYRTVVGGSLIVKVGSAASAIYDAWSEHAVVIAGGSILVWGLASGLAWLLVNSRRREWTEGARLAQARRLEMMGRIAGGIAHDLGNTIKIARTTFTLLRPSLVSRGDAMALVDDADRSLKSAFDIIDRLLAFARRQELSPRSTDLGELISGFVPILRQAAGVHIELDLLVDGGRPLTCVIDPIHLESALLNLVLNSKDSMPNGGRISIELREAQAPRTRRIRRRLQPPTVSWAEIVVRDTGSGMSPHVLEHAFEPFFTTRKGGSGLGLSQVLGFVKQSAGEVRIESRAGAGTTVSLLFPTAAVPLVRPATHEP